MPAYLPGSRHMTRQAAGAASGAALVKERKVFFFAKKVTAQVSMV